jgi:DNA-binding MarR family transcriptional regulator
MVDDVSSTQLFDLVYQSAKLLRAEYARRLQPMHLTPSHTRVLRTLARLDEPVKVADLAVLLGVRPRSATGLLTELVSSQLVRRRSHPTDGRAVMVSLTPKGRRTWSRIVAMADDVATAFFAPIPQPNRNQIAKGLVRALDESKL